MFLFDLGGSRAREIGYMTSKWRCIALSEEKSLGEPIVPTYDLGMLLTSKSQMGKPC